MRTMQMCRAVMEDPDELEAHCAQLLLVATMILGSLEGYQAIAGPHPSLLVKLYSYIVIGDAY